MMGLGSLYYYGARGMARDQARAFRWFERAALLGDPAGQAAAADLLMKGEGVVVNATAAVRWYRAAADQVRVLSHLVLSALCFCTPDTACARRAVRTRNQRRASSLRSLLFLTSPVHIVAFAKLTGIDPWAERSGLRIPQRRWGGEERAELHESTTLL